jgi:hypothetical protein
MSVIRTRPKPPLKNPEMTESPFPPWVPLPMKAFGRLKVDLRCGHHFHLKDLMSSV